MGRAIAATYGARLADARVADDETILTLYEGEAAHRLELPRDTARLPRYGGNGQPRRWNPAESHRDAWVLSPGGSLWVL